MIFSNRIHINFNIIFRLSGMLLCIEALFMSIALIISIIYDERDDIMGLMWSSLITFGTGLLMSFLTKNKNSDMGKREGFLLTGITWLLFSIFGSLPFILCPTGLNVASAFFESASGITTTGASVITDVENCSHGILMWRAISHFIGGIGIILFTLAVLPMLNKQSGVQLFNAEVTGITHDKVRPRISHTAKCLWIVYIALIVICAILLWIGPMNFFDAICHSLSTISTGGFSTKNLSIEGFNSDYIKIIMTIFMFLSGINFALLFNFAVGNRKALLKNDTFKWYSGITLLGFAIIFIGLISFSNHTDILGLFIDTLFQTVSAITSSGFTGSNFTQWHGITIITLLTIMFVGSCAGSTAGGAKIDRLMITLKNTKNEIYRILHPNTIMPIRANGKVISQDLVTKTGAFLLIFVCMIIVGTTILIAQGFKEFDALFTTISCASNNGLGYGATASNFSTIPDLSKYIMSLLMIIGRLEIFTIIIIFTRTFWNKE